MKTVRWTLAVATLALAGGISMAAGVSGAFDALVSTLQSARSSLTAKDQARVDKAVATLQASSTTSVASDAASLAKAVSQLGKLPKNDTIAPGLDASVSALYLPIVDIMGAAVFAYPGWIQSHPGLKNLATSAKNTIAMGKARTKLDAAQNSTTKTAAQKLAVFVASAKVFAKVYAQYSGGH